MSRVLRMPPPLVEAAPFQRQIAELEEQVEHYRQRAEAAEAILRGGDWHAKVRPLSLTQTRIMRLLARYDLSTSAIMSALEADRPNISYNAVKVQISAIRRKIPDLAPLVAGAPGGIYTVPDRDGLRRFLAGTAVSYDHVWEIEDARLKALVWPA